MTALKSSLIISTYNWPEALELCLLSVLAQETLPDEILIADDGSGEATKFLIEKYRGSFNISLKHVWHEDNGFRLAQIRNKAIAAAKGDYIIQIDGDLILHKKFISDHIAFSKSGSFVRASRIYLDQKLSKELLVSKSIKFSIFNKGLSNKLSALHVPFLWNYFEYNYKSKGDERYEIHGCNMAFWRKDAIAVNGYNEDFKGWGPEDKEFVVRLLNSGVKKRFIKMGGQVFHIYHNENMKENLNSNLSIFKDAIKDVKTFCVKGINQYL
ncbi:MAG: glycosyltransferase family 2 protein [Sphingobacteriaceae bacterium]|nr:glycosyltransferase family 2 protein [Sphingobacteriaceae bacterium]